MGCTVRGTCYGARGECGVGSADCMAGEADGRGRQTGSVGSHLDSARRVSSSEKKLLRYEDGRGRGCAAVLTFSPQKSGV